MLRPCFESVDGFVGGGFVGGGFVGGGSWVDGYVDEVVGSAAGSGGNRTGMTDPEADLRPGAAVGALAQQLHEHPAPDRRRAST